MAGTIRLQNVALLMLQQCIGPKEQLPECYKVSDLRTWNNKVAKLRLDSLK